MKTKKEGILSPYERLKKWRKEHPEKLREQWLRRYQKHAETIKANKRTKYRLMKNDENKKEQ